MEIEVKEGKFFSGAVAELQSLVNNYVATRKYVWTFFQKFLINSQPCLKISIQGVAKKTDPIFNL